MVPLILSSPEAVMSKAGQSMTISIRVAAVPDASYQWLEWHAHTRRHRNNIDKAECKTWRRIALHRQSDERFGFRNECSGGACP